MGKGSRNSQLRIVLWVKLGPRVETEGFREVRDEASRRGLTKELGVFLTARKIWKW